MFKKFGEHGHDRKYEKIDILYSQPLHLYGYGSFEHSRKEGHIFGTLFKIGDTTYLLSDETDDNPIVYKFDQSSYPQIHDQKIVDQIHHMAQEDKKILQARKEKAADIAKDNVLLMDVLILHMHYTDGKIEEPIKKEGVNFYKVGRNASHEFYIGEKEGKRYSYIIGEGGWDEEGNVMIRESIKMVDEWNYLGHRSS